MRSGNILYQSEQRCVVAVAGRSRRHFSEALQWHASHVDHSGEGGTLWEGTRRFMQRDELVGDLRELRAVWLVLKGIERKETPRRETEGGREDVRNFRRYTWTMVPTEEAPWVTRG